MNTYLGISSQIGPEHIPTSPLQSCEYLFFEGYLFDKDAGKEAFYKAADITREAGGKSGISLSDPFCVDRHRDDFRNLVLKSLDYVIGNEAELLSLYQVSDTNAALTLAAQECDIVVCTRSGDGACIRQGAHHYDIPITAITPVDTTGAGDQFAAGFLYGLSTGADFSRAGQMGCTAAGEVIRHVGPRPQTDLKDLFSKAGLI